MQFPSKLIGFLFFFGVIIAGADPIRQSDISAKSPWAAHLDAAGLRESPLGVFLVKSAGFDRVLQLEDSLKAKLSLDAEAIDGVTLFGSGKEWKETAMLIRGNLEEVNLEAYPLVEGSAGAGDSRIFEGPKWDRKTLYFAKPSEKELIGGTSVQAVRDSLEVLRAPAANSWQGVALPDHAKVRISSASALLALDMKRIGGELKFEADLTRAAKNAWFLIGSHGEKVEVTLMIDSTDAEGLLFLQNQWQLLTAILKSGNDFPAEVREMVDAVDLETQDHWMTAKVVAPPEKIGEFLKALKPLFQEEPAKVSNPK